MTKKLPDHDDDLMRALDSREGARLVRRGLKAAADSENDWAASCALMEQLFGLGAALKTAGDEEEE